MFCFCFSAITAFDDTQGSSATDDFDGIRSDWSMMYESANNIQSPSRRWMALLKGIDDIRLISNYSHESELENIKNWHVPVRVFIIPYFFPAGGAAAGGGAPQPGGGPYDGYPPP